MLNNSASVFLPAAGIGFGSTSAPRLGMHRISSGPLVDALREALVQTDDPRFQPAPTGAWEPDLEAKVRAFQTFAGGDVDGIVGPETRRLLIDFLQGRANGISGWDLFGFRPKIASAIRGIGGIPTGALSEIPTKGENVFVASGDEPQDEDAPLAEVSTNGGGGGGGNSGGLQPIEQPWADLPAWEGGPSRGEVLVGGGVVLGLLGLGLTVLRMIRS